MHRGIQHYGDSHVLLTTVTPTSHVVLLLCFGFNASVAPEEEDEDTGEVLQQVRPALPGSHFTSGARLRSLWMFMWCPRGAGSGGATNHSISRLIWTCQTSVYHRHFCRPSGKWNPRKYVVLSMWRIGGEAGLLFLCPSPTLWHFVFHRNIASILDLFSPCQINTVVFVTLSLSVWVLFPPEASLGPLSIKCLNV